MKKAILSISTAVAILVAGCGGGTTPYAPIIGGGGGGGTFGLTGGGQVFVNPGSNAVFTINVGNVQQVSPGRATDPVQLTLETALPAGCEASFNPNPANLGTQSTLTITTSNATPIGSYPLTVKGTNSGGSKTLAITMHVNGGDFIVEMEPANLSILNGGGGGGNAPGDPFVEYAVSVRKENDILVGPVDLTINGIDQITDGGQPIFEAQVTPPVLFFTATTGTQVATVRLTRIRTTTVTGTFPFSVAAHLLTITKPAGATITLSDGGGGGG